jgi:hypothetical protein
MWCMKVADSVRTTKIPLHPGNLVGKVLDNLVGKLYTHFNCAECYFSDVCLLLFTL